MSVGALISSRWRPRGRAARLPRSRRPGPALAAALAAFALAAPLLMLAHHRAPLPLARSAAIARFYANPESRLVLDEGPVTRIDVLALDPAHDELEIYDGARLVGTATVTRHGVLDSVSPLRTRVVTFGSALALNPWVLVLLSVTFALMTVVWPLRRLQNLDVVVALAFIAPVVLFNQYLPRAFALTAYPALAYLTARCAWRALGPAAAPSPSMALFDHLTARLGFAAQRRLLRAAVGASGLVVAMVGFSSLHVIDVGYAVMEGATLLLHGVLPYGHIPDVMHGDTYPLGSYLLYVPLAALWPVRDVWGDADPTLAVAIAAAGLVAWGLARWLRGLADVPGDAGARQRQLAGLRAACAWLCFPALLATVSTGTTDVVLAVAVLGAVALWRRPAACTGVLALGAWFKLAPLAIVPLALARLRGRAWAAALAAAAAASAPLVAALVALGGPAGVTRMLHGMTFQQSRGSIYAIWSLPAAAPLQGIAQAAVAALLVGACVRTRRDRRLARDRVRAAALCAAVLLGVQFAANYWSYFYLAWVLPLVCLSLCQPPAGRPASTS